MNIRVVFVLAVALAVCGGVLVVARSEAQAPSAATMPVPPTKTETPATSETPGVTKPTQEPAPNAPTPAATASPPAQEKPAAAKAPEPKPTPVVTAPQPEKPAAAKTGEAKIDETKPDSAKPGETKADQAKQPEQKQSTPVATTPAPAPKLEMKPKPVIVMTPLPEKRPEITKALIERTEPAKELFGAVKLPSEGKPRVIGYYSKGCLAGAVELPITGPHWQVMRLSRNRNWGHPELIRFIKRFSAAAAKATGWPGILIGDMAQPRGGPLPFGHVSHQVGLDVDIWYTPMPDHTLTRKQRATMSATHMVAANRLTVNKNFTSADAAFLRTVAQEPGVERVLVNAAIKKKMCELEGKHHDAWMAKLRPWYGHTSHIHVRLKCPADSPHCRSQPPVPRGEGCSKKALAYWFSDRVLHPKPAKHPKPRKQIMLANLPAACKTVLNAPAKQSHLASEKR
jgi:penicillin-insensitive murein DD-endopeptidase